MDAAKAGNFRGMLEYKMMEAVLSLKWRIEYNSMPGVRKCA